MPDYDIDFELMGIGILIIVIIYFRLSYGLSTDKNQKFLRLSYGILISQVLDIITAFTFTYSTQVPSWVNQLLDTLYFAISIWTGLSFLYYILAYVFADETIENEMTNNTDIFAHAKRRRRAALFLEKAGGICYAGCLLLLAANWRYGFFFSFANDKGAYVHGSFYMLLFLIPACYVLSGLVMICFFPERFTRMQIFSAFLFVFSVLFGTYIQAVFLSGVYLTYGIVSLALLIILFSLETPDYQKLNSMMKELEEARDEANRANRVKGDFLAQMSHEIRTPINTVLGMNEMILRESREKDIKMYAGNIQSAGRTLLSLINSILDFSKIEDGKMELQPIDYETLQLIDELVSMADEQAKKKDLLFHQIIDPSLPVKLHGDDVRIRQIVINLLTNAVKYTRQGSVTLSMQILEKRADRIWILISVKDTGMGIRDEDKEKLFESFARLDEKKNRGIEGTGLGISIVQGFLKLMGSTLEVDSVYGEGSDFHFTLEQRIVDYDKIGSYVHRQNISYDKDREKGYLYAPDARILVIDDNKQNLLVTKSLLKRTGIQVDTAISGMEGLEKVEEDRYDVLLLDHMMPEMDGIETLKILKDRNLLPAGTKVVMMTANAIVGAKEEYLDAGFDGYLAKPMEGKELEAVLTEFLPTEVILDGPDSSKEHQEIPQPVSKPDTGKRQTESKSQTFQHQKNLEKQNDALLDINFEAGRSYAMGDDTFYRELKEIYVSREEKEIQELQDAFEQGNIRKYQVRLHDLNSNSKMIGALEFASYVYEMEKAGQEGNVDFIKENHPRMIAAYRSVVEIVQKTLEG